MNRPSLTTYLIGNPLSVVAVAGAFAWAVYISAANGASWIVPAVAGAALVQVCRAGDRLGKYTRWKREWDGADGRPTSVSAMPTFAKRAASVVCWIGMAGAASAYLVQDPQNVGLVALVWIGMALASLVWLIRHRRPRARVAKSKTDFVTVVVGVPRTSPHIRNAYEALPSYCLRLGNS